MESYIKILFIALLSLNLLASLSDGRKNPETYWEDMMKEQPMPKALEDFINQRSYEGHHDEKRETIKEFIKDFDPNPNISVYHDDNVHSKELKSKKADCKEEHHDKLASKKFDDEFEPIPNISTYND